jgi:hypothetical protein
LHQEEFRPRSVDQSDPGVEKGVFGGATEKNGQKDRSKQKTPAEQMDAICPDDMSSSVERSDREPINRERAGNSDGPQAEREDRAANGANPAKWVEALARLNPDRPPGDVSPLRWRQFVDDVHRFADHWAARAQALGWEPIDLFGWDTSKPFPNIARHGLAWRLEGRQVVDMSEKTISFTSGGSRIITLKRTPPGTGWMLAPD